MLFFMFFFQNPNQLTSVHSIPHLFDSNFFINELPTYQQAVFHSALARLDQNRISDWDSNKSLPPPKYSTFVRPDTLRAPPSYRE